MNKQGEATPEAARRQVETMVREDVALKLLALGEKCHARGTQDRNLTLT